MEQPMDLEALLIESRRVADALLAVESAVASMRLLLATGEVKPRERTSIEVGLTSCQIAKDRISARMLELDALVSAARTP
jgi:hypothetical protein